MITEMGKEIIITEHHTESEIYNYLYSLHETFFDQRGGGLMKKYRRTILKAKGDKYLLLNDYEINNVTILLFGKMIKKNMLFGIIFVININGKLFSYELRNPLTAILGQTEVALSKDRNRDEYRL